jgi:hypothetical protein
VHSPTNLKRLLRRAENAALAALAGGLRAERALDRADKRPTRASVATAERLRARAGELRRSWEAAQAEYDREREASYKAVSAVERRKLPTVPTKP